MEEQLITFETAKLAKEKGFNIPTWYFYNYQNEIDEVCPEGFEGLKKEIWQTNFKNKDTFLTEKDSKYKVYQYSAPTQALLQKWLREIHNIHLMLEPYYNEQQLLVYGFDLLTERTEEKTIVEKGFKTYEEALEVGLQEGLKLISNEL